MGGLQLGVALRQFHIRGRGSLTEGTALVSYAKLGRISFADILVKELIVFKLSRGGRRASLNLQSSPLTSAPDLVALDIHSTVESTLD